jgi:Trypsin
MRRLPVLLLGVFGLFVVQAAPVVAITNGVPDTQHPNVGALLVDFDPDGAGPASAMRIPLCSGSLLTPTYFLTAGHCVAFLEDFADQIGQVLVSFDQDLRLDEATGAVDPANVVAVTSFSKHPDFVCNNSTCYNDVGVLTLAQSVAGLTPVNLPTLGFLDQQAAKGGLLGHIFVNVGYGVNFVDRSVFSPNADVESDGLRRVSTSPFETLTRFQLFLQANSVATGQGGSCFGDSGSPKFFEEVPGALSNLVVALTTSGDPKCQSLSQNQRLDTPSVRAFLDDFLTLP